MSGRRNKPLSIDRHKLLGEELQSLREKVLDLAMKNQDGLNRREVDALIKIHRSINHARSVLEDRAVRDHQNLPDPSNLYFGRR